jgi:hypothetical protein
MARYAVNRANKIKQRGSRSWSEKRASDTSEVISSDIKLSKCIKGVETKLSRNKTGKRKETPGRIYDGFTQFIDYEQAEYLYLSNGFVARGVDTEAAAIIRNGIQIVPDNKADQKELDKILQENDIEKLVFDIARNISLYGRQWLEIYDDPTADTVKFTLLPISEMDYLRDKMYFVLFDRKTGEPAGYAQWRYGQVIAKWEGKEAQRITEFKYKTLSGTVEGIPTIQNVLLPSVEYGFIRSSLSDSFIRTLPVAHIAVEGATPEDIEEVTTAIADKFTARTVYVTSERFTIEDKSGRSFQIDPAKFVEPLVSEIAACFHMPIEMIAPTENLKGTDFEERYAEWIEFIKVKQKLLGSILEKKVFSRIFKDPVKVHFNSPVINNPNDLIKNVGFAVQSGAIGIDVAYEILIKNQVFGPLTPSFDSSVFKKLSPQQIEANKVSPAAQNNPRNAKSNVPTTQTLQPEARTSGKTQVPKTKAANTQPQLK